MSKVVQGQSFVNKVLEQTGGMDALMKMALLNGRSITDDVPMGLVLTTDRIENPTVINILKERQPANAQAFVLEIPTYTGIGLMEIANNFIVG